MRQSYCTVSESSLIRSLSFEQSLAELEKAVQRLEEGDLSMDDALASYEKGIRRLKQCYELLAAAERKIAILVGADEDGNASTQPFPED